MINFKRIKVSEYIKANFLPPFPCSQTIIRSIKQGTIPGSQLGGLWFVHVDDSGNPIRELNEFEIEALKMYQDYQIVASQ